MKKGFRTVDLFCGGGGMSLGFTKSGFDIVAAFDKWPEALAVYRDNFGHPAIEADLSDDESSFEAVSRFEPEVVIGGPPCQDFSSAGNRSEGGRADMTARFAGLVTRMKPLAFVMENVERARHSKVYEVARTMYREAGYGVTEAVLDASFFGVPQTRKRLFLVGVLGAEDGGLSVPLSSGADDRMTVREHFSAIGVELPFDHYYRHPRSYARRGIFSVDEPSPTVRGVNRPVPPAYVRHKGDTEDPTVVRAMTTRERALVQTFPPGFFLPGTKTGVEQVVGNAVPVNLAAHVGVVLRETLDRFVFPESSFSPSAVLSAADGGDAGGGL